jgi:hypothetical protein
LHHISHSALAALALTALVSASACQSDITPQPGEICLGSVEDFRGMNPGNPELLEHIAPGTQLCAPMGDVYGSSGELLPDGTLTGRIDIESSSKWSSCAERVLFPTEDGEVLITNTDGRHDGGEAIIPATTEVHSSSAHCSAEGFNVRCELPLRSESELQDLLDLDYAEVYARSHEDCLDGWAGAQCRTAADCSASLPAAEEGTQWGCAPREPDTSLPLHAVLYVESIGHCVQEQVTTKPTAEEQAAVLQSAVN